jgi:peptidoglycan/LPS O-acetylase OafA/YrhL
VIDEAELRQMSPEERADLARALAGLNARDLMPTPISQRRRRMLITASLGSALILAVWIGILEVKLPRLYRAGGWQAAWVGFDIGLLVVFLATAWAAWRRRQVLIGCLMVLATLLCCDAWFDTMLDYGTRGFLVSLLSALVIELPLAVVALIGARRLLRLTIGRLELLGGGTGPVSSFWRVPLFGDHNGSYRALLHKSPAAAADNDTSEPEAEIPRPAMGNPAARGVARETCG